MELLSVEHIYDSLTNENSLQTVDAGEIARGGYEDFLLPPTTLWGMERRIGAIAQNSFLGKPPLVKSGVCLAGWEDVCAAQHLNARRRMVAFPPQSIKAFEVAKNFETDWDAVAVIHAIRSARGMSAVEVARAIERLTTRHGSGAQYTQMQVARLWGQTQPWVHRKLQIVKLPQMVQTLLHEGEVGEEAAILLGRYEEGIAQKCWEAALQQGKRMTTSFVREFVGEEVVAG